MWQWMSVTVNGVKKLNNFFLAMVLTLEHPRSTVVIATNSKPFQVTLT